MEEKKPTTIAVFDAAESALTDLRIAEFERIEAEIAALRERVGNCVYDATTTDGMKIAKADRAEVRTLRTDIEKYRVIRKRPLLDAERFLDTEAKRITALLRPIEAVPDGVIKAEEDRKAAIKAEEERIEQERINGIDLAIGTMKVLPVKATGRSSHDIRMLMVTLIDTVVDDSFGEFQEEATAAKAEVMAILQEMHTAKAADEEESKRLEVERKELEAKKAEQDELEARRQAAVAVEKAKLDKDRQKVEDDKKALEVKREAAEETEETEPMDVSDLMPCDKSQHARIAKAEPVCATFNGPDGELWAAYSDPVDTIRYILVTAREEKMERRERVAAICMICTTFLEGLSDD